MPALSSAEIMKKIGLTIEDGQLVLRSPYNANLVNDCREIPGREWHSESRINTFPLSQVGPVREMCKKYGFPMSGDVLARAEGKATKLAVLPPIEVLDTKILIRFDYDKEMVASIKRVIPAAAWHAGSKTWRTPIANLPQVVGYAKMWNLELPPGIEYHYDQQIKVAKELHDASMAMHSDIVIESAIELMPYQRAGVEYLAKTRRSILADEVGLGKTAVALAAVVKNDCFPVVVICPNTLKLNWELEVEKFFPHLSVNVVSGGKPAPIDPADVVVINYDICSQRSDDIINLHPKALICDEAHAIKNSKSKFICPFCGFKIRVNSRRCPSCRETFGKPQETWTVRRGGGVMKISRAIPDDGMKLLLTGTPIMNRPDELVAQLVAIDRIEDFGGRWRFVKRYGANHNLEELNRKLRETCMIRRSKADIFTSLPPIRHAKQHLVIESAAMNEYRLIEHDVVHYLAQRAREIAEEAGEDGWSAYVEKRMRAEAAEHLVRISVLKSAVSEMKFKSLVDWISQFLDNGGEKLIVFGEHISMVERLSEHFGEMAVKVRGGVKNEDRMDAVKRFQNDESVRLFIGNIAAASEGLTLTASSNVAIVELPWTFSAIEQCIGRAYGRVSDLHGCTAWYPMAPHTIEDDILTILQQKKKIVDAVTDGVSTDKQGSVLADLVANLAQRGMNS